MSAIAAFCALNCAVSPMPAAELTQPQLHVQIPTEVEPQIFETPTFPESEPEAPIFNGVQVEDRTNEEQQQFSLDLEPEPEPESESAVEPELTPEVNEVNTEPTNLENKPLRVLEVVGDRQEFDEVNNIVTAVGNVVVRFNQSVLTADRLQINLNTKLAIAEGDVALQRGQQLLRGERFDYFFVQNRGYIRQAQGEVSQRDLSQDLSATPTPSIANITNPAILLNERLLLAQPITNVVPTTDGLSVVIGSSQGIPFQPPLENELGLVNRVRYYAEEVEFFENRWEATNIRLTNDPFNPPELQVVADTATYRSVDEFTDELVTTDTRLVIDDNISLPIYPRTYRFSRSDDEGIFSLISFGFDDEERGGFFIQRRFTIFQNQRGRWTITPQYLFQKAFFPEAGFGGNREESGIISPEVFGFTSQFNYNFSPRSFTVARASVPNLDFEDIEDRLKVNFRFEQLLGKNLGNPFRLSQEYNYRDRLFNGSLGFQDVQQSIGVVLRSPRYTLGKSGFSLDYQASIQNIDALTDRVELLGVGNPNDEVNLTRYQAAVTLDHGLNLWSGQALPATPQEGLRFTPRVVVPYFTLVSGVRGVSSIYSNGDEQVLGTARIGFQGQLGHFSRNFFDYTGFNVTYSIGTVSQISPFLFDRFADSRTLSFGLTQQLYGPIRAGFQSVVNLDNNTAITTDYILEYSRRTHSILLRYNPVLEIGSFNFRINDFDWSGSTDPFVNQEVRPVIDGVIP